MFAGLCQLYVLVYPLRGNPKPGIKDDHPEAGKKAQRFYPLPYAMDPGRATINEERHIGSQPGCERKDFPSLEPQTEELIETHQRSRGIAAAPTQTRAYGDSLADVNMNRILNSSLSEQEGCRLVGEVAASRGDIRMIACDR